MTRILNKRRSLYVQLFLLLLVAVGLSAAVFLLLNRIGDEWIEKLLSDGKYVESKNEENVSKIQEYIIENELSTRDSTALSEWVKNQEILSLSVYKDGIQVFDSAYPDQEIWDQEIAGGDYTWLSSYPIRFSDGNAKIVITGLYGYRLSGYALVVEICVTFLVFLIVVFGGVRKKMAYILKLSQEVEVLEGGCLDYPITVRGEDELAVLAEGLDSMRRSFRDMMRREEDIVRENQRVVTEMSHDIRTPVTSIMLYTEILKKEKYGSKKQLEEYLDKIEKKTDQLRQLTDHLFKYALNAGEQEADLEDPEQFDILFYDLISETCHYLEQKGFRIDLQLEWSEEKICICSDYVMRIMDNITSNIVKYADPRFPIRIGSVRDNEQLGFCIENRVYDSDSDQESTGIGIQNMKNMMRKMNGECRIKQQKERFRVQILFPEAASHN